MVKVAFSSQIAHAHEPGRVLTRDEPGAERTLRSAVRDRRLCLPRRGRRRPLQPGRASCRRCCESMRQARSSSCGREDSARPLCRRDVSHGAEVSFERGDRLLLYTDGITEARNRSGAWFGDGELQRFLADARDDAADRFVERLIRSSRSGRDATEGRPTTTSPPSSWTAGRQRRRQAAGIATALRGSSRRRPSTRWARSLRSSTVTAVSPSARS